MGEYTVGRSAQNMNHELLRMLMWESENLKPAIFPSLSLNYFIGRV